MATQIRKTGFPATNLKGKSHTIDWALFTKKSSFTGRPIAITIIALLLVAAVSFGTVRSSTNSGGVIFADNFQSGSLSAWDGTSIDPPATCNVTNTGTFNGSAYALQSYVPANESYAPNQVEGDAFAYKNLDNYTDLYASCWVKWISFGDSPTLSRVLKLAGPNGDYAISAVGVEDVNGTFEWALHYRDGDEVYHAVANASTPLQLNSWYFVEIYGQVSSASGASEGWINGEKFESVTGIDNQLTGDICQLRAGLEEGGQLTSIAAEDYINDVTVSTSYIPYAPYSGLTQPPSPTLSPATKPVLTGTSIIYILLAIAATVLVGAVASIIVKRNASRYKPKLEKIENAFPFSLLVLFM